jgi:hypothetical protein
MEKTATWDVLVPRQLDADVRKLLKSRGMASSDLPAYVEDVVRRALALELLNDIQLTASSLTEDEAMDLATQEVAAYRREKATRADRKAA